MHICCRFSIILAVLAASVSAFAASTSPSTRSSRTLPPAFETNVGQVKFSDGSSTAYVDAVIRVNGTMAYVHRGGLHLMQTSITPTEGSTKHEVEYDVAAYRVDMELIASNPSPRIEFQQKAPGIIRHILPGGGKDGFVADRYNAIVYHEVWPGIDLRMHVNSLGVKYDFVVHPGADAQQIAFRYVGGSAPTLQPNGDLTLTTPLGTIGEHAPVVFESHANGVRGKDVGARFLVDGSSVRFRIEDYNRTLSLVVDPQRVWGTYYGWNNNIETARIAADPFGNIFISGSTTATNMPNIPGVLQRRFKAGVDGFITKFTEAGAFVWHTYYGGSKNDRIRDITCDSKGNIWACGQTDSPDLPNLLVGSGPYGDWDSVQLAEAMVLKLLPNGSWGDSWQVYGRESDVATGIAVSDNAVAIVGYTRSPKLGNVFGDMPYRKDSTNNYRNTDIFVSVVKPKPNNAALWSHNYLIFYGGGVDDIGGKIVIDKDGNVIFGGITYSPNFPVTDATVYKSLEDIVVVKFGPTPVREWATMFGSIGMEDFGDLAVDATGSVCAVGLTYGNNFPTLAPIKGTIGGSTDGFIRKIAANGATQWSTYYGSSELDGLYGVGFDKSNNVWVAGFTNRATDVPITTDAFQTTPNGIAGFDGYLAKINANGSTVLYGSHHGAPSQNPLPPFPPPPTPPNADNGNDIIADIVVDGNAYVTVVASLSSYRMDTTAGAYQDSSDLPKDTLWSHTFVSYFSDCKDSVIAIVPNGPSTLCDVDSRQLLAPAGFDKYLWSTGATTRAIVVTDTGSYSVLCTTVDGCRYRDTLYMARNPKPSVSAGRDTTMCKNGIASLFASPSGGTAPFKFKWNRIESGPEFLDSDTTQNPNASPGTTSRYEVTATDSAGCIAKDTVLVTVVDPRPNFSPAIIDVGNIDACTPDVLQEISIGNPHTYEIRIETFTPDNASISLVTPIATPIIVAPGGVASLFVRIAPTAPGTTNGTFTLSGSPCEWKINFQYKAFKQQLTATIIPGTVNFGAGVKCDQGETTDSTTVRNGSQDVLVLEPGIVAAPFSIVSPTTPVSIDPGKEQRIYFRYTPGAAGTFSAVAKFAYTAGACADTLRASLNALTSEVTVTTLPSTIDVGTLSGCENERDTTVTINNTSTVAVTVTLPSTAEVVFNPAGPITIAARSSQDVRVTVRPSAAGAFSQTSTLVAEPCTVNMPVTFTAQKNGIAFTTPPSVDFGEFSVCESFPSTSRTTQLSFDGTGSASIASVTTGPTLSTTLVAGQVLTSGQPATFNVVWTPALDGPLVDSIVIVFEPCSVRRVIRISGMRTSPRITANVTSVPLGAITGFSTGTISFTNSGTDTVSVVVTSRSPSTVVVGTRPANLSAILPGAMIEVDYRVTCASSQTVLDSIEASIPVACAIPVFTSFTGTCSITQTAATSHIAIDTAAVKIGDRFSVPIRITSSQGLNANNLRAWTANVTYNPMVVVGAGGSTPDCFVEGQFTPCTITINGTRGTDTVGQIGELAFTAVLGTTDITMLTLSNFVWTGNTPVEVTTTDGKIIITDICREGGDRYLEPKLEGFSITVFPTPASTDLTILVKGAGTTPIPWSLANYVGLEVASGTITPDASGTGQAVVDVRSLGAGLYLLTTDARGTTYRNTVLIQR